MVGVKEMTGKRFGSLVVIRREPNDKYGNAMWLCRCDCGREFVTQGHAIRNGHTRSCGHIQREKAAAMNATHRMSNTALYKAWAGMKQRCENPNNASYHDYGARGITVCMEWHDFEVFYKWAVEQGYKPGLTIERKNNDLGYCPSNCTLATRTQQNQNTNRTHRIKTEQGYITAAQAARIAGVNRATVATWARDGIVQTLDDVINRAAMCRNKHRR